ncbi:MAG: PIG-L family deacetylase [Acidobacteriota bacterium]
MSDPYVPESALVVVAHPDDIEFSCAGTLALWAQHGAELVYVVCTSGESGIDDASTSVEEARKIREAEQRAAAEVVGVREVLFLREPDGLLQASLELRETLVGIIRRTRPEVVVSGDPTLFWINPELLNHPDHRAASLAALEAAWPAAGQRNLYPKMEADPDLQLHRPRKFYCTGWVQPEANTWVDIEATLATKAAALNAHVSQTGGHDLTPLLQHQATLHATGQEMQLAESFRVTTLVADDVWQQTEGNRETGA